MDKDKIIKAYMGLSKIHDCEACRGKIVSITIDKLGVTRCGYCNEAVDYKLLEKDSFQPIRNGEINW